jgi:hypothetical protein
VTRDRIIHSFIHSFIHSSHARAPRPPSVRPSAPMSIASFLERELNSPNPAVREANAQLLRSVALFVGSVVFFRTAGELMAV